MLTYSQGLALAQEHAPELKVDPYRASNPMMFIVRKVEDGQPFSIHLPDSPPNSELNDTEKAEVERNLFIDALKSAKQTLGVK